MNAHIRDRILRHLETLSDEKGYQVLDYIEFLESKYAQSQAPSLDFFQRFAEGVEDTMRAGRLSTQAIAQTVGLLNRAAGVVTGVAAAGKSVASDIVSGVSNVATGVTNAARAATSGDTGNTTPSARIEGETPAPDDSNTPRNEANDGPSGVPPTP
jgi:hypothetical protein